MKWDILATDYDGTIAQHSVVDPATVDALCKFKESGRKVFLVTGRELHDLFNVFSEVEIFDRIIAENGALWYNPQTREKRLLCDPPPEQFAIQLRELGVKPLSVGCVIVATQEIYSGVVEKVIRNGRFSLQIIPNKGSLMVLPQSVDKASGLRVALKEFDVPPQSVVGVGDGENDATFLQICGHGVAVANALPSLKKVVHFTTEGHHGEGVRELVRLILGNGL